MNEKAYKRMDRYPNKNIKPEFKDNGYINILNNVLMKI